MKEVHCNNCEWEGDNSDLVQFEDDDGLLMGCPNCKTDSYLTNKTIKCDSCGELTNVETYTENDGLCDKCELSSVSFDVYEDNGFGVTAFVEKHIVEGIQLKQAKETIDYLCELYSEKNSSRYDQGFLYFENPTEVK